jgi:hypothetical protein
MGEFAADARTVEEIVLNVFGLFCAQIYAEFWQLSRHVHGSTGAPFESTPSAVLLDAQSTKMP